MLLAVALVCVAIALFVRADYRYQEIVLEEGGSDALVEIMRIGAITAVAGAIGVILRKVRICLWVALLAIFVRCLFLPQVY
jgi:hypothetical protein